MVCLPQKHWRHPKNPWRHHDCEVIFADPMAFDLTDMILVGGDEVDICADDDESMSVMICIPKKPFMNINP